MLLGGGKGPRRRVKFQTGKLSSQRDLFDAGAVCLFSGAFRLSVCILCSMSIHCQSPRVALRVGGPADWNGGRRQYLSGCDAAVWDDSVESRYQSGRMVQVRRKAVAWIQPDTRQRGWLPVVRRLRRAADAG